MTLIAQLEWFAMEATAIVGQYLITTFITFVLAKSAERERVDVTQIQNVKGHLSVELIIVQLDNLGLGAAQHNAIITPTAQVENVMLNTINAV